MTLKEMRDQVKLDGDVLSAPEFPDARLNNIINQAQKFVQIELNGLGMKKWESIGSGAVNPIQFGGFSMVYSDVPTDMLESPKSIIQVEVGDGGNSGIAKEVGQTNLYDILSNTFLVPTIAQPVFARIDNKIYFSPNTISVAQYHYYKRATDLSGDTDVSEIPDEFTEYIIRRSVSQVEKALGKTQESLAKENDLRNDIAGAYEKFVGRMNTEENTKRLE